jgi:hypothetical protein
MIHLTTGRIADDLTAKKISDSPHQFEGFSTQNPGFRSPQVWCKRGLLHAYSLIRRPGVASLGSGGLDPSEDVTGQILAQRNTKAEKDQTERSIKRQVAPVPYLSVCITPVVILQQLQ